MFYVPPVTGQRKSISQAMMFGSGHAEAFGQASVQDVKEEAFSVWQKRSLILILVT